VWAFMNNEHVLSMNTCKASKCIKYEHVFQTSHMFLLDVCQTWAYIKCGNMKGLTYVKYGHILNMTNIKMKDVNYEQYNVWRRAKTVPMNTI
jgi:hypothetical protein